jgi:hypothetical protein
MRIPLKKTIWSTADSFLYYIEDIEPIRDICPQLSAQRRQISAHRFIVSSSAPICSHASAQAAQTAAQTAQV